MYVPTTSFTVFVPTKQIIFVNVHIVTSGLSIHKVNVHIVTSGLSIHKVQIIRTMLNGARVTFETSIRL